MDLNLTDEQRRWQSVAAEAARVADPAIATDGGTGPEAALRALGAAGLLGLGLPTELGGRGCDAVALVLALEAVASHDAALALAAAAHVALCAEHIRLAGTPNQQREWLPRLASGETLGAWIPAAGSVELEPGSPSIAAARGEDGAWVLDGARSLVTGAGGADVLVVLAGGRTESTAFLLQRSDAGLDVAPRSDALLHRAGLADVRLSGCVLPEGRVLGPAGQAAPEAEQVLAAGRLGVAAVAAGLGRAALGASLAFLRGGTPGAAELAERQPIQWLLADAATELDAARLVLLRAASRKASGAPFVLDAAMARLQATRAASRAVAAALRIRGSAAAHAGPGGLSAMAAAAQALELETGSPELHLATVAREVLRH